jgi:DNA (cytosine-5)-methyltransferase 3A
MNILSLFDGISCGRVALERAGISVSSYYTSEIDTSAISVVKRNYPYNINVGDVINLDVSSLPNIDLLIGGSPCQGFSKMGLGYSFEDPRSALFFRYVQILEDIRPRYFLLENVVMKQEWQDIISFFLGVQPIKINSALVSAQNRNRLYWTNIDISEYPKDRNQHIKDILSLNVDAEYYIDCKIGVNITGETALDYLFRNIRQYDQKMRCLTTAGQTGCTNSSTVIQEPDKRLRLPTPIECERAQTLPDNYTYGLSKNKRYSLLGNGWTVDVIAHILKGMK